MNFTEFKMAMLYIHTLLYFILNRKKNFFKKFQKLLEESKEKIQKSLEKIHVRKPEKWAQFSKKKISTPKIKINFDKKVKKKQVPCSSDFFSIKYFMLYKVYPMERIKYKQCKIPVYGGHRVGYNLATEQ